jgi:hypothetical protein
MGKPWPCVARSFDTLHTPAHVHGHAADCADDAHTLELFYASSLPTAVGRAFAGPALPALARAWLRGAGAPALVPPRARADGAFVRAGEGELRAAARAVFDAALARLGDAEIGALAERWAPRCKSGRDEKGRS